MGGGVRTVSDVARALCSRVARVDACVPALLLQTMATQEQSTVWYGRLLAVGMLFAAVGGMLAQIQKPVPAMCALLVMQVRCALFTPVPPALGRVMPAKGTCGTHRAMGLALCT